MKKILYTFINIIMFGTVLRAQTTTFPRNGVQDERPNTYAFVNATIVSDANTVLEGATLVIKGSVIEAVGKNITLPAGTQVIDLKGKRIYPSLVEAYSSYGMPELKEKVVALEVILSSNRKNKVLTTGTKLFCQK
jgi:hypothetical protein